jgi:dCTP deaminase
MFFRGEENKLVITNKNNSEERILIESRERTLINPNDFDHNLIVQINDVDSIVIPPKTFFMGVSMEYIKMPRDVTAICNGKSTVARSGIQIYVTPLEAGWNGFITLEFFNSTDSPVLITAGMGISQLNFVQGNTVCDTSYADRSGKYQNQGPQPIPPLKRG